MTTRRKFLLQTAGVAAAAASWRASQAQEKSEGASDLKKVATGANVSATVHPLASQAATAIMSRGGNAIDAAIAAALCLSVVDGHNSGLGGGCLMLVRLHDGAIHAIDGREKAPSMASKDMFSHNGVADTKLSQDGPLACGVPGMVAALHSAHQRFGKLPWSDLFEPAIRSAFDGYRMNRTVISSIRNEQEVIKRFPESARILSRQDGKPYETGDLHVQRDLATTLGSIAKKGSDWFYQGTFANRCSDFIRAQGGILSRKDFSEYRAVDRMPLSTTYRDYQVVGFPAPSSGGIHIQQMLQILSRFSLKDLIQTNDSVEYYHVLSEAMKLAFADRAHYLGDSDFVDIPDFLTSIEYTNELAARIQLDKASHVPGHNASKAKAIDDGKKHTTHMTTADAYGNWVAMTATINTGWGNKMIVPGTGVVLNNQMDDFSISPGVPNAFGLVGSEANAIEPGKRPLSSMSPTMVMDSQGMPVMTCGAAGGPKIINATLQTILRRLDLGVGIGEAIAASRIHHQWQPDVLFCESSLGSPFQASRSNDNAILERLQAKGHVINVSEALAVAQGIEFSRKTADGRFEWTAACDPRAEGVAASV